MFIILDITAKIIFCAKVNNNDDDYIIEIEDKNGNRTKYIVYTCTYDEIESSQCINVKNIWDVNYTLTCNNDSECLSNKCYKDHCMYNNETSIVHCDDIYSFDTFKGDSSYMHCGKPPGDTCQKNDDCSSMNCASNKCQYQNYGPSETNQLKGLGEVAIYIGIVMIVIVIVIISCCCFYRAKHK